MHLSAAFKLGFFFHRGCVVCVFFLFFLLLMFHCRACEMGKNPSLVLTYYNVFFLLAECICDFVPLFFQSGKENKCGGGEALHCTELLHQELKRGEKKMPLLGFSLLFHPSPMKILEGSGRDGDGGRVMRRWRGQSPRSRHP